MRRFYTDEELTELTLLADEAKTLDKEWRVVMEEAGKIIDRLYGFTFQYEGKEIRKCDPAWHRYTETIDLAEAVQQEFRVAPFEQLPTMHHITRRMQRPAEWRKLNTRVRKAIVVLRNAVARHTEGIS